MAAQLAGFRKPPYNKVLESSALAVVSTSGKNLSPMRTLMNLGKTTFAAVFCLLFTACDGAERPADASSPATAESVSVAVRIDGRAGATPSASFLAFRGATATMTEAEILASVDPLFAAPPTAGCVVRALDANSATLLARSASVELSALTQLTLTIDGGAPIRPVPSVYPDLAGIASGIVAEAGPFILQNAPKTLAMRFDTDSSATSTELPALPTATGADGETLTEGSRLDVSKDHLLQIVGPSGAFVEIRPFGTTEWLACTANADGKVLLPGAALQRLARFAGAIPVSLDVVWRDQRVTTVEGIANRINVSVELRSSALVGLSL